MKGKIERVCELLIVIFPTSHVKSIADKRVNPTGGTTTKFSHGNEGVTPYSPKLQNRSLTTRYSLVSYPGHTIVGFFILKPDKYLTNWINTRCFHKTIIVCINQNPPLWAGWDTRSIF